ncbi:MAG: hypothetical protein JSW50_08720, partial [Candidatus Latescibacterota bacterium]
FACMRAETTVNAGRKSFFSDQKLALGAVIMLVVGFLSAVPYWATGVNDTGPVKTYELIFPFIMLIVLGIRCAVRKFGVGPVGAFLLGSFLCAAVVFWPPQLVHIYKLGNRVAEPLRLVEYEVDRPALVFVSKIQRSPHASWVHSWPAAKPDLSDSILYVRDLGAAKNRAYWELHPHRHAYRLTSGRSGFQLLALQRAER